MISIFKNQNNSNFHRASNLGTLIKLQMAAIKIGSGIGNEMPPGLTDLIIEYMQGPGPFEYIYQRRTLLFVMSRVSCFIVAEGTFLVDTISWNYQYRSKLEVANHLADIMDTIVTPDDVINFPATVHRFYDQIALICDVDNNVRLLVFIYDSLGHDLFLGFDGERDNDLGIGGSWFAHCCAVEMEDRLAAEELAQLELMDVDN